MERGKAAPETRATEDRDKHNDKGWGRRGRAKRESWDTFDVLHSRSSSHCALLSSPPHPASIHTAVRAKGTSRAERFARVCTYVRTYTSDAVIAAPGPPLALVRAKNIALSAVNHREPSTRDRAGIERSFGLTSHYATRYYRPRLIRSRAREIISAASNYSRGRGRGEKEKRDRSFPKGWILERARVKRTFVRKVGFHASREVDAKGLVTV